MSEKRGWQVTKSPPLNPPLPLGWCICKPSMLNLLCFAFKISFSPSSWLCWIGKSNFCAEFTFWIKFAWRALLPIWISRWRRFFLRSSTFQFCNFPSVKCIVKELKECITTFKHSHRRLPQQAAKGFTLR